MSTDGDQTQPQASPRTGEPPYIAEPPTLRAPRTPEESDAAEDTLATRSDERDEPVSLDVIGIPIDDDDDAGQSAGHAGESPVHHPDRPARDDGMQAGATTGSRGTPTGDGGTGSRTKGGQSNDPDSVDVDIAAAEYVLGTLRRHQRRAFEAALVRDPSLRTLLDRWETRLAGLAATAQPKPPPPGLWERIERDIGPAARPLGETRPLAIHRARGESLRPVLKRLHRRMRLWRALAIILLVIVLWLVAERAFGIDLTDIRAMIWPW